MKKGLILIIVAILMIAFAGCNTVNETMPTEVPEKGNNLLGVWMVEKDELPEKMDYFKEEEKLHEEELSDRYFLVMALQKLDHFREELTFDFKNESTLAISFSINDNDMNSLIETLDVQSREILNKKIKKIVSEDVEISKEDYIDAYVKELVNYEKNAFQTISAEFHYEVSDTGILMNDNDNSDVFATFEFADNLLTLKEITYNNEKLEDVLREDSELLFKINGIFSFPLVLTRINEYEKI